MVDGPSFSALPPRPPTPPRSSSFNSAPSKIDTLQSSHNQPPLSTPDGALSSLDLSPHPHSSASKKVNFSPLPTAFATPNSKLRTPLRTLLPSNQCRPSKSILKTCSSPAAPLSDDVLPSPVENLPAMLESISHQLAGESRTSRADAYKQLVGALTAYRNLPDENALADKIESISGYIRRDICEVAGTYNPLDIKVVRQALKLLILFIFNPNLSLRLSDDLRVFIIDHSIASLQNPNTPKVIVTEYLRVLAVQNFSPKIVTSSRIAHLLSALNDITTRIEGKAVVAHRLEIYERLLYLPQAAMASQADLWMDHLVTALHHNVKEIRTKAIHFGKLVAVKFGPNAPISAQLRKVLDIETGDNSKFVLELCRRLTAMISNSESSPHVPQIWSVVILLLRNKRWAIDQWDHLKEWLLVIQKCFNCSDLTTKSQALVAWDLLVYSLPLGEATSNDIVKLLFRPIHSQLERKKSDKQTPLLNQAFSTYHKLLYYAFRPSTSHARLELFWTAYMKAAFSENLNSDPTNNRRLCQVLASLLWNPQPKVWDENKIKINKVTVISAEDLPRLDCKWVRSRLSVILPLFESLFRMSTWSDENVQESSIAIAWLHLSKALADASSKEITPSSESMQAIASILGILQRVWKTEPESLNATGPGANEAFHNRFHFLLKTSVSCIGSTPFTDKLLLKTSQETFQTSHTPTHHRRTLDGNIKPPIFHLFDLIVISSHPGLDPAYFRLIQSVIEIGVQARTSRSSQLETLRQFSDICIGKRKKPWVFRVADFTILRHAWRSIATLAKECLTGYPVETAPRHREDSPSHDYENVIAVLAAGSGFSQVYPEWSQLLDSFRSVVMSERGEIALAAIPDMLAELALLQPFGPSLYCCAALLDLAVFIPTPDQPPPSLHPSANKPPLMHRRTQQPPSHDNLAELAKQVLEQTYEDLRHIEPVQVVKLCDSMAKFCDRCPSKIGPRFLEKTQGSLGLWLADRSAFLTSRNQIDKSVLASAQSLIRSTANLLQQSSNTHPTLLQQLSILVTSGLESRHKSTVNIFIKLWNNSFGTLLTLEYPENVERALRRLKPFVHLLLPNFPPGVNNTIELASPEFLSSQDEVVRSDTPLALLDRHNKLIKTPSQTNAPSSASRSRRRKKSTPLSSRVSTPKPRLRHDDSQIQFVPVESSPTVNTGGDTQVLTENQREVRDRQRGETAKMFPGLRSSASQIGQDTAHQPNANNSDRIESAPPTPSLHLSLAANDEELPGSSPTPSSKNHVLQPGQMMGSSLSSMLDLDDIHSEDLPSSPPQIHDHQNTHPQASKAQRNSNNKEQDVANQSVSPISTQPEILNAGSQPDTPNAGEMKRATAADTRKQDVTASASKSRADRLAEDDPNGGLSQGGDDTDREPSPSRDHARRYPGPDRVDLIPDSFSDDLEQQIASQLEQDLELSMDMELADDKQQASDASILTRSMKRKREDNAPTHPDRAKRPSPSPRSSRSSDKAVAQQPSKNSAAHPESVPPGDDAGTQRKRPSRSRRTADPSRGGTQTSNPSTDSGQTSQRKSKKRRSQRLNDQSIIDPPDEQIEDQPEPQISPDRGMTEPTADVEMQEANEPPGNQADHSGPAAAPDQSEVTGILASLRSVLGSIRTAAFGRTVLREIDDVMFDIRVEAHDAARRHEGRS
ncbi:hypothetical protein FQN53_002053 [Emmonsiellopsis sp. PD_33]|nr:hypothetical protein FQN53_002053 [Emmonsiellopsis sp. PD_33]